MVSAAGFEPVKGDLQFSGKQLYNALFTGLLFVFAFFRMRSKTPLSRNIFVRICPEIRPEGFAYHEASTSSIRTILPNARATRETVDNLTSSA